MTQKEPFRMQGLSDEAFETRTITRVQCVPGKKDDFVKSHQGRRHSKKLQMQGARNRGPAQRARGVRVFCGPILRNEAYIEVHRNDER